MQWLHAGNHVVVFMAPSIHSTFCLAPGSVQGREPMAARGHLSGSYWHTRQYRWSPQ